MAVIRVIWLLLLIVLSAMAFAEVPLLDLALEVMVDLQWEPYRKIGVLKRGDHSLVFRLGTDRFVENYREERRAGSIREQNGAVVVSDEAAEYVRAFFGSRPAPLEGGKISAIVIDPGHGGKDAGTFHSHEIDGKKFQLLEKNVVLAVAKDLNDMLSRAYPEKRFVLTRDSDVYLTLEERVEVANSLELAGDRDAIIFVSVHVNASLSNPNSTGYEVWYLPPEYGRQNLISETEARGGSESIIKILGAMKDEEFTVESVLLAKMILEGLDETIGDLSPNRGLFQESWFVVRNARMPSVLVELGFATNKDEALLMTDPAHLRKMAEGLYNGIRRFIQEFESTNGFTE